MDRIVDVLNTIDSLSGLQNIRVEGLEPIVVKYRSVVDAIKKKSYDLLDHRKPDVRNLYLKQTFLFKKKLSFSLITIIMNSNLKSNIFKHNYNYSLIHGSENLIQ